MPISQKNRPIKVSTPLGEDVLLFYRMHGTERLGGLFEYELDLLSENASIDPDKLLGENVTVGVSLPEGEWRYFNGYVAKFGQHETLDGFAVYRATLRPWLWFLTRAANCRIFQNTNVPEIVKQVFRDQGFSDFTEKLSGVYAAREYCVQYRETDFDFASRLMEEEGIYYYFTHENGKHHLVLADSPSAHDPFPGYEKIPYHPETGGTDKTRADHLHAWTVGREVQPGAHALTDYDFKKPKADLRVKSIIKMPHAHAGYEQFDYPGRYVEIGNGENLVRSRMEQRRAEFEGCTGHGNARGLGTGNLFKL
ncbi:MAG: type VI secretion system tip protein TssI/VgrG, partial [Proteobacteria bacterium]|nr:type VI secretion system tip protein TssI/VgrG [Pseudomonadota bacterium]